MACVASSSSTGAKDAAPPQDASTLFDEAYCAMNFFFMLLSTNFVYDSECQQLMSML